VLSDFSEEGQAAMATTYGQAVAAIETFLRLGIEEAMNQHNSPSSECVKRDE